MVGSRNGQNGALVKLSMLVIVPDTRSAIELAQIQRQGTADCRVRVVPTRFRGARFAEPCTSVVF